MNKSAEKFVVSITVSLLFIFAGSGNLLAKTGYEKCGETIFGKIIEDNSVMNENRRESDFFYKGNSINNRNIMLADNAENRDPIDSSELDDPIDRTEVEDPVDRNDSEKNDPIDKEDRDNHPINSAERGQAPQGDDIDNDGDN